MPRGPISFLSDYGLDDEFVGVVHRVIASAAPGVAVIDVTHRVPPHDVRAGALTLWRAAPWLAPGVILAVVDPGVGTARRPVALEVATAGAVLVGPDNGVLLPAALALGSITAAVELDRARSHGTPGSPERGATFDGRDVFAPAAALIATGAPVGDLGEAVDPGSLAGQHLVPRPPTFVSEGRLEAEVLWVDRFGNAQLNVSTADARALDGDVEVVTRSGRWTARRARAFADLPSGEMGLVSDSYGMVALCLNGESAAAAAGLHSGDPVWIGPRAVAPGPGPLPA